MGKFEDWTYNDFLCYLMIMGASADLNITEEEQEEIEKRAGTDEFKKIKRCFDTQNDAERIETITDLYGRFRSQIGGKENLVKEIRKILTINDRHEHVMDRYLMMMLKKILN